jgi:hypothetical protein
MRSVWNPLNALSTRWTCNSSAFASSEHAVVEEEEEESFGLSDGFGVRVAVWVVFVVTAVVGLGEASVIVIVVTPFAADTLTSAPVAPSRKTAESAPDFA